MQSLAAPETQFRGEGRPHTKPAAEAKPPLKLMDTLKPWQYIWNLAGTGSHGRSFLDLSRAWACQARGETLGAPIPLAFSNLNYSKHSCNDNKGCHPASSNLDIFAIFALDFGEKQHDERILRSTVVKGRDFEQACLGSNPSLAPLPVEGSWVC